MLSSQRQCIISPGVYLFTKYWYASSITFSKRAVPNWKNSSIHIQISSKEKPELTKLNVLQYTLLKELWYFLLNTILVMLFAFHRFLVSQVWFTRRSTLPNRFLIKRCTLEIFTIEMLDMQIRVSIELHTNNLWKSL